MPRARYDWHPDRLHRSTKSSGAARTCTQPKRLGLEDSKNTASCTATQSLTGVLLCVNLFISGCLSDSFEIRQPLTSSFPGPALASEILLEVEDTSVKWGSGKVGEALSMGLVKNRIAQQAYYPIYPAHHVPIKVKVVARGDIHSEKGLGMVKAFITGFLLFLPSGIIQYEDTFSISGSVSVIRGTQSYGPLTVEASVAANHILFSSPEPYARRASALALEDFASRTSLALSRHPEWFSP